MKPAFTARSLRSAPRQELPPLTWPAPLDALPPLDITKAPGSPGWADTQPVSMPAAVPMPTELGLFDVERGTAFEESLNGLQVRELIGSKLFERLFGPR
ncbi:MAG TPA: hypothetical protein VGQ91_05890 [Ideonella sp.]|jgi:hypothetical protein|nr:hypothetical protein [Ideonella sp.]